MTSKRRSWHGPGLGGVRLVLAAAAVATAIAALPAQEPTFPARATGVSSVALRQLFADYWRWHLAEQPEDATRVGVHDFDDRWHDWSRSGRAAARERRQEFLRNFQYAGLGNLTNRERLSLTLVMQRLASELASENLRLLSRLSPGGAHQEVFTVVGAMPAGSIADYERLLARLRAVPTYVEQHVEAWSEQLAAGVTQPASVVDHVVADIDTQRRVAAERSPLLAAFRSFAASIPPAERARLEQAAHTAYDQQFGPAWERLGRFLRDTYRPRARADLGIGQLLSSPAAYAALLAYYGAPIDSVDALHEQAMAEASRDAVPVSSRVAADRANSKVAFPEFRRHLQLPAFDEGWRVYSMGLTREAGVKAALDSGIHARGWSRERALAFVTMQLGAGNTDNVVDVVTATPGEALAVFAGARTFAGLRLAVEARLGKRFNEREFERMVLENGALPLDLLELQVAQSLTLP